MQTGTVTPEIADKAPNGAAYRLQTEQGYPIFDWLRFVLASVVALVHAQVIVWPTAGNLAVKVFFCLSGFLIGGILLKSKREDLPKFFFKRATRIWAPYMFAVGLLYLVAALREPITARWLEFLYYDATFTHNLFSLRPNETVALAEMPMKGTGNHFWSIAVEEQFYLVSPLLIIVLGLNSALAWGLISAALLLAGQSNFASISLGVFLATGPFAGRHRSGVFTAAAGVAIAASTTILLGGTYELAAPLLAVSVISMCAWTGGRGSLGALAGAISYPMYLNHWIGMFVAHAVAKYVVLLGTITTGLLGYGVGVLAGAGAYFLVDRNVLAWRDQFYSQHRGIILACVAYTGMAAGLLFGVLRWL